jgi:hypothetical protein
MVKDSRGQGFEDSSATPLPMFFKSYTSRPFVFALESWGCREGGRGILEFHLTFKTQLITKLWLTITPR